MLKKFKIINTDNTDYPYNVQMWVSLDCGKNYYYSGTGCFCKTTEDAEQYIKSHSCN